MRPSFRTAEMHGALCERMQRRVLQFPADQWRPSGFTGKVESAHEFPERREADEDSGGLLWRNRSVECLSLIHIFPCGQNEDLLSPCRIDMLQIQEFHSLK